MHSHNISAIEDGIAGGGQRTFQSLIDIQIESFADKRFSRNANHKWKAKLLKTVKIF